MRCKKISLKCRTHNIQLLQSKLLALVLFYSKYYHKHPTTYSLNRTNSPRAWLNKANAWSEIVMHVQSLFLIGFKPNYNQPTKFRTVFVIKHGNEAFKLNQIQTYSKNFHTIISELNTKTNSQDCFTTVSSSDASSQHCNTNCYRRIFLPSASAAIFNFPQEQYNIFNVKFLFLYPF